MATHIFRGILLASLAAVIGCGEDYHSSKPEDKNIAGMPVKVVPYRESSFWGDKTGYLICELPGLNDCYSPSAYKKKLAEDVDRALGK